ncbi:ribosome biogenesis GTP-binding protein YihA/YsxC [Ponticaulis koreensis]|uniref:ribosome biogenesis GTP-binding protein YihA/YsxC n=1 Tax=Ponticaulis koreensis TaxID=1123045 RepID=UPI0003B37658|nr:ribosome biogenesis GTP-binding protein YihA/YsxC [Ponticaulis koreensis]
MSEVEYTDKQIEQGRLLFAAPVDFVMGVTDMRSLPPADYPEICFAGRSNVGKSSLINALTNRKNLARSSNEPGRTRELNYFNLNEELFLVDLPGFGYARASKTDIARWTKLTLKYLQGRPTLKRVFLLIDSRRGVMESDEEIMSLLDTTAVVYQVVLTKTDKLKAKEREGLVEKVKARLIKRPAFHPIVMETSSEKGFGVAELRAEIATLR